MATSLKIQTAQRFYDAGVSLFQESRYSQALVELKKAEEAFRKIDARGRPFSTPLSNGVSGLANTLALEGLCYEKLGDSDRAIVCFETSLINVKFERKKPFLTFLDELNKSMLACYERKLQTYTGDTISNLLQRPPSIDTSFCFPFSLDQGLIPIARLYEIAPERYGRFKPFYRSAYQKDAEIRLKDRQSDESTMRRMGVYIWITLFAIWSVYIIVFFNALSHK